MNRTRIQDALYTLFISCLVRAPWPLPTPLISWILNLMCIHPSVRPLMRIRNRQPPRAPSAWTLRSSTAGAPLIRIPRWIQLIASITRYTHKHAGIALHESQPLLLRSRRRLRPIAAVFPTTPTHRPPRTTGRTSLRVATVAVKHVLEAKLSLGHVRGRLGRGETAVAVLGGRELDELDVRVVRLVGGVLVHGVFVGEVFVGDRVLVRGRAGGGDRRQVLHIQAGGVGAAGVGFAAGAQALEEARVEADVVVVVRIFGEVRHAEGWVD